MLERNAAALDLPRALMDGRELHPREAVRDLADAVVHAANGPLQDDATVLILDWHGAQLQRSSEPE